MSKLVEGSSRVPRYLMQFEKKVLLQKTCLSFGSSVMAAVGMFKIQMILSHLIHDLDLLLG